MNNKVIHSAFEYMADLRKDKIAVETSTSKMSYSQLNSNANILASLLIKSNLEKGEITAAFLNDPLAQLISLLGIFKAGSIYIPIDKKYNQNHWDSLYMDIQPKVLIVSDENMQMLNTYDEVFEYSIPQVIAMSISTNGKLEFSQYQYTDGGYKLAGVKDELSSNNPNLEISEEDPNYIFFTSGSTGKPKAVKGVHKSLNHFVSWANREFDITEADRIGLLASFSFDASLHDIFSALTSGSTLVIPSAETKQDMFELQRWISDKEIGVLHMVPTLFRTITSSVDMDLAEGELNFSNLRYVLLAGEKLYHKDVINWRERFGTATELVNLYGTTETTCLSTFNRIGDEVDVEPSGVFGVGQPISNTMILILNSNNELCHVNEVGSVYIRTPYTTSGYFNDQALTDEKFIQNPLLDKKDIIYKTGDYGKYDQNRNITILGRQDGVVKISGVRVDVNSIEKTILELEKVNMVKCILKKDQDNNFLVACFFTSDALDIEDVRTHCVQFLSQYEVPSFFFKLDQFPMNTNGKVDVPALEEQMSVSQLKEEDKVGPRNEIEKRLIDVWEEILEVENIGITDDFLLSGGNSIRLIKLKVKLHQVFDVALNINDLFINSTLEEQAELIIASGVDTFESIPQIPEKEGYTLSSAQYRLWVLSQIDGSSEAYNMPSSMKITIDNVDNFKQAIHEVINRHEVLRTVFKENSEGTLQQLIKTSEELQFSITEVDFRESTDSVSQANSYVAEDSYKSFDLENGPLLRIALLQISETEYIFYYNIHHIIGDAKSMQLLSRDVQAFYESLQNNEPCNLPELPIQYKDYASWQIEQLSNKTLEQDRIYWTNYLSGTLPTLNLPTNKLRNKVFTYQGRQLTTVVNSELTQRLKSYCQEQGGTLFMGLLSIWSVLFYKYTSQKDIIIGSPVEGRDHADLENQIGLYVNTLVHRNQIDQEMDFNDLFQGVKTNAISSFDHQQYPLDELLEDLSLVRDMGRNAVFDVLLTLHDGSKISENNSILFKEKEGVISDRGVALSQMDLVIDFLEVGDKMYFQMVYNTDVYEENMIRGLMSHFLELCNNILSNPEVTIHDTNYLLPAETNELLNAFNDTHVSFSEETSFLDRFNQHVKSTPDKMGVIGSGTELSYRELDEMSNKLAHYLKDTYTLSKGDFVVINIERDQWVLISILAIFKLGCAYIPVDPSYPEDRKQYILNDSNSDHIIDTALLSLFKETSASISSKFTAEKIDATDLAYVIYTSGSTGNPKGVMIEHRGMMNHLCVMEKELSLDAQCIIAQNAPYTFDISVWQLLNALLVGGTTSIYSQETILNTRTFLERLENEKTTILQTVPSYLKVLLKTDEDLGKKSMQSLNYLLVTGEAVGKELVTRWFNSYPGIRLVNAYGPAEASDDVTLYIMDSAPEGLNVPIGYPIDNMNLYILDENLNLCAKGVTGEICVSGIGISRGYLNKPELTQEKFIEHPFIEGERLYRTGDLGKMLLNGNVEFMGRKDNQVKVNGHRIELGEVEHYFKDKAEITEAVVTLIKDGSGLVELAVYFEAKDALDPAQLHSYASTRMPSYMVPSHYMQMEQLPLTPNGKIDRQALPDPKTSEISTKTPYKAPANETEEKLTEVWERVLEREKIGVNDDFFELGGNSIKTIFIIHEIEKVFEVKLKMTQIFLNPTIAGLSTMIQALAPSSQNDFSEQGELIL